MKRTLVALLSLVMLANLQAAGPDDQFLEAYNLIQQADSLSSNPKTAADQYTQAQNGLKKIQSAYPTWEPEVIKFRLEYVAEKLAVAEKALAQIQPPAAQTPVPPKELTPQEQIADLKEQIRILGSEKSILERKLKEAFSSQPAAIDPNELAKAEKNITNLKKERDLLAASLEQEKANQPQNNQNSAKSADSKSSGFTLWPFGKKSTNQPETAEKPAKDQDQISKLRTRLAVLEANPVPYTAEELALIKQSNAKPLPGTALPAPATQKATRSVKDIPAGAGTLMAEAQRAFASADYATAEKKFAEVLRQDENNVYVLSHLASAQLSAGHVEDCEKNVNTALKLDPEDAASLFLLGNVRLKQNKLDEALDSLSRSATINPTNAATQNALGGVLNQKGLLKPAETALRKAIQIDPTYSEAHYNLAIVYAVQKPPFLELARWHYKKALDLGQPKNAQLEKILNQTQ